MIRLFNVYYPVRTLVLLAGEALIVWTSFLLGTVLRHPEDAYILLNYQNGYYKISIVTVLVLAFSHLFDLYNPSNFDQNKKGELYFRLLMVPGFLALLLALIAWTFPNFLPKHFLRAGGPYHPHLLHCLAGARRTRWLSQQSFLRERVYVLGTDERAQRLVQGLRTRSELGIDVVGWSGNVEVK